ncbi:hypothetical protein Btru_062316 [Bulinus truncatus]|nr:hypothetical protein Btru_062316 [Bulinus truncatus]
METAESSSGQEETMATMLFCRMCQAVYRQPKILQCLHSFCRPCLVNAVSHTAERGTVIVCPVCSIEGRLPPNGIVGIPDNCFLNRLCQEYVSEVQSHLAARSLHGGSALDTSPRPSEFSALRTRLSDEMARPKYSSGGSPISSVSSRPSSVSSSTDDSAAETAAAMDVFSDRVSRTGKGASDGALEAIRNMSRIQAKIMSLQGEALRVTYAIDHVNESMIEWHQNREDLRRAVQRRASQYQFFIKRLEHQLISQIDSKQADDQFYAESDESKTKLRKNLKNILHEVSVLKRIQEKGKDDEINALSAAILGKSAGMSEVSMKKFLFEMSVPTKSIEEIVNEGFGKISLLTESSSVFLPEVLDFTNFVVESTDFGDTSFQGEDAMAGVEGRIESFTEEKAEEETRRSKRRNNERRTKRHNTDLGLNSPEVQDYLAQFQTARETFRERRREILLQGQQARDDPSPARQEVRPRPRSGSRKGRVQSLDRSTVSDIIGRPAIQGLLTSRSGAPETSAMQLGNISSGQYMSSVRPKDISLPSPVIEEASIPSSPIKSLVKQISDPRPIISSPLSDISSPIHEHYILDQDDDAQPGGTVSSRRHSSDQLSPLALRGRSSVDILDPSSRPVRRALSAAGDRKSKMEFLRESWQRRKEILIQNEGFVSPEGQQTKAAVRPAIKSPPVSPVLRSVPEGSSISHKTHSQAQVLSPPMSPSKVKVEPVEPMQQLISRLSHFRQIIQPNGSARVKAEQDDRQADVPAAPTPSAAALTSMNGVSPVARVPVTTAPGPLVSSAAIQSPKEPPSPRTPATGPSTGTMLTSAVTPPSTAALSTSAPPSHTQSAPVTTAATTTSSDSPITKVQTTPLQSPPAATTQTTTGYVSSYGIRSPLTTAATTASTTNTSTSSTSKYSRYEIKPAETFDVAAMIAAMYSGNEKAIISTKKPEPEAANTKTSSSLSSTTTPGNAAPATSASNTSAVTAAPTTTGSTSVTTTGSSSIYSGSWYSRYSSYRTTSQDPQTAATSPAAALTAAALTSSTPPTTTSSNTSNVGSTTTAVTAGTTQVTSFSTTPYARLSAYYTPSTAVRPAATTTTPETLVTTSVQPAKLAPATTTHTATESALSSPVVSSNQNGETPVEQKPKYESRRSRYSGQGINRRHTIEVGRSDIQDALALNANSLAQRPSYSNYGQTPSLLPPVVETDQGEDAASTVTHRVGLRGPASRFIPAPLNLQPLQEGEVAELQQSPARTPTSLSAAVAAIKSPSLSPTSPDSSLMKGRIRDIARKKKERWRHLTIH